MNCVFPSSASLTLSLLSALEIVSAAPPLTAGTTVVLRLSSENTGRRDSSDVSLWPSLSASRERNTAVIERVARSLLSFHL